MTEGSPNGHTHLDFNAPLSDARAAALVAALAPLEGARVLDLGCGWAELLLRIVDAEPTCRAVGVDAEPDGIARGRRNILERGLADRVELVEADVTSWIGTAEPADVVVSIGASHAWGGTADALATLAPMVRPGGRLLFGDGIWEQTPTPAALSALDATPDEFLPLAGLVDLAMGHGLRPLTAMTASLDEWDDFESRWCAGRDRWLLANPQHPDAEEVAHVVDDHRHRWLHGYRGILGFAYLVLGAPAA